MYAMGLLGLLLAGLIALGAALGLFSGPDSASAARVVAEGYVLTRSASLDAVRDTLVRSRTSTGIAARSEAARAISPTAADLEAFAPPGWIMPTGDDGSPRWLVRLEGNVVYVYGPADATEMAAIRNILRYPEGLAWCPPQSADGAACTPPLGRPQPDGTLDALPLPPEVKDGEKSFAVSAVELNL